MQVWENCRLYNDSSSEIVQIANGLEAKFIAAWAKAGLPTAAKPSPLPTVQHPHSVKRLRMAGDGTKEPAGMVAKPEAATPAKPEKKSLSQKGRSGGVNAENGFLAEVPRQATPAQLAAMLGVLEHMIRVPIGRPFAHPVKADDAPGYADVIARPMDLGSIAKGLTSGHYTSIGDTPPAEHCCSCAQGTRGKLLIIYFCWLSRIEESYRMSATHKRLSRK